MNGVNESLMFRPSYDAIVVGARCAGEMSMELFDVTDEIAGYRWSLPELKNMHLRLSDAMNREVAHLAALSEELPLPVA
jgi:hypothetical protein